MTGHLSPSPPFMSLPRILTALGAILVSLQSGAARAASTPPPNIVLIFIDDLGYADIGPFGNRDVRTPHLDRLAAEGMKFTSFYATPVCSMSRASLLTGCYNVRVSIPGVLNPTSTIGLHPDEVTLAEIAKARGYATAAVGKWHLGHLPEFLPTRQGFDSYFGIPYSNDMGADARPNWPKLPLMRGERTIELEPDQSQLTRRYTEEAEAFIRAHAARPFFLYLPHTMVHGPLAASENFRGKSKLGEIGDVIEEIDWSVGRIMATLRELNLDERTLVIFTSDNGAAGRAAPPFRGSKGTTWEGGVREPCIMRWPGRIPAGTTCDHIAGNIDLVPTFAALLGVPLPTGRVIDGRDLSPLLSKPAAAPVRDTHLYFDGAGRLDAIRQGPWKLFLVQGQGNRKVPKIAPDAPAAEKAAAKAAKALADAPALTLYNLADDIGETTPVTARHPEIVARLKAAAETRLAEIQRNTRPAGQSRAAN